MDRGKQGTKRSVLVEGLGMPLGTVVAAANRHDSPLLRPTLETLSRFRFDLLERITVHLDAGYDSKATRELHEELGCDAEIAVKGVSAPHPEHRALGGGTDQLLAQPRLQESNALYRETDPGDPGVPRSGQ